MEPQVGSLLIASPHLLDPNFFRSVVLLFQYDEEGAAGLVLNRPLQVSTNEIWPQISPNACAVQAPVYGGGPVGGPLMALHSRLMYSEICCLACVLFSVDRDHVVAVVEEGKPPLRIFSGYAGWGPGQLEREIQEGSWMITATSDSFVFSEPDTQWRRACDSLGRQIVFGDHSVRPRIDPLLN